VRAVTRIFFRVVLLIVWGWTLGRVMDRFRKVVLSLERRGTPLTGEGVNR